MAEVRVPTVHGHSLESDTDYRAGIVAGFLGIALSGLFVMIVTAITESDFFLLAKLISGLAMPTDVATGTVGIIIGVGVLLFLGIASGVLFGMLYTLLTSSYAMVPSIILGVIYSFGLWFVSYLVVGPVAGAAFVEQIGPAIALPGFLILGLTLGICYREFRATK